MTSTPATVTGLEPRRGCCSRLWSVAAPAFFLALVICFSLWSDLGGGTAETPFVPPHVVDTSRPPIAYLEGEPVPIKTREMTSTAALTPVPFYDAPVWCLPQQLVRGTVGIGDTLLGSAPHNTPYSVQFGVNVDRAEVCHSIVSGDEVVRVGQYADADYRVAMEIPGGITVLAKSPKDGTVDEFVYAERWPLPRVASNIHLGFTFWYHQPDPSARAGAIIVGADVVPSVDVEAGRDPASDGWGVNHTYSVEWVETQETPADFARRRWDAVRGRGSIATAYDIPLGMVLGPALAFFLLVASGDDLWRVTDHGGKPSVDVALVGPIHGDIFRRHAAVWFLAGLTACGVSVGLHGLVAVGLATWRGSPGGDLLTSLVLFVVASAVASGSGAVIFTRRLGGKTATRRDKVRAAVVAAAAPLCLAAVLLLTTAATDTCAPFDLCFPWPTFHASMTWNAPIDFWSLVKLALIFGLVGGPLAMLGAITAARRPRPAPLLTVHRTVADNSRPSVVALVVARAVVAGAGWYGLTRLLTVLFAEPTFDGVAFWGELFCGAASAVGAAYGAGIIVGRVLVTNGTHRWAWPAFSVGGLGGGLGGLACAAHFHATALLATRAVPVVIYWLVAVTICGLAGVILGGFSLWGAHEYVSRAAAWMARYSRDEGGKVPSAVPGYGTHAMARCDTGYGKDEDACGLRYMALVEKKKKKQQQGGDDDEGDDDVDDRIDLDG